ncbi:hypothetical protein GTO27_06980 [Candidatus Bathyarchaeota archaeon]|nr:hypothetical protein [Candidatus Bathyarchaeota archaeon]
MIKRNPAERTFPRREIMKASFQRDRFLPMTISPATYRTTTNTRRFTRKTVKEKTGRSSWGISSHQEAAAQTKVLIIIN